MDKRSKVNNPEGLDKVSVVELAVAALDGNANPLDADMGGIDTDPTSLDLDDVEEGGTCSDPQCTRSDVDECIVCGQPLCED